ncbi:GTPase HflX [Ferrimicrobium acidiphilum]|uniref:GTPase HflX n=1 Tax=Ferrimicrobium acidiphilum TaxID=121039 RepID=UPI0023F31293|nr:GTPase HflX [Ferrimicrobium acidiphilum]MCL5053642.1 GTPase HflX [Gammaproteobacteria bacterium]
MTLIERSFQERILLVGVATSGRERQMVNDQLDELASLVDTAGALVVHREIQVRERPDPATYIGKGKVDELAVLSESFDVDTVVFDDELTPGQQRNLEKVLGRTAIDRTAVILDVFAQNARSQEGKAQVELALLRYRLPRLVGRRTNLSQQVGRIGTRGPGETKLEEDRRRIQERIGQLRRELAALERQRRLQRKSRLHGRNSQVALVGYTNVGKSSLLNALTGADVVVEDRLFATLDPRTRRLKLPGGETILLADTVGFIRKLPHQLIEAFRSTLDAVAEADLLIHVVDASSVHALDQMREVRATLAEIGASEVPELVVLNKIDLGYASDDLPDGIAISVTSGEGVNNLLAVVGDRLRALNRVEVFRVPFDRGDILAEIHREAEVLSEENQEDGIEIRVRADDAARALLRRHIESVVSDRSVEDTDELS